MRSGIISIVVACFVVCSSACKIEAQTITFWTGGAGSWSAGSNWSNGVPQGDFTAIINGSNQQVTQDVPGLTLTSVELTDASNRLILNEDINISGSFAWAGGTVQGSGNLNILQHAGMLGGNLDTTVNNFGRVDFVNPSITGSPGNTAGPVWNNFPGSLIVFDSGGTLGNFANQNGLLNNLPEATIRQLSNSATYIIWDVVNDGVIEVDQNAQILFVNDFVQSSTGLIHLTTPYSLVDMFSNSLIEGRIEGEGGIIGQIELHGSISPGQPDPLQPFGSLQISGGLDMASGAVLEADVGAGTDRITVMHNATVGGTVTVTTHDGTVPGTYTLVAATQSLSDNGVTLAPLPEGIDATLQVTGNELQLIVHSVAAVVEPERVDVSSGILNSGDATELAESDNNDLSISRNNAQIQSVVEFSAMGTSPTDQPASISIKLESSVFARTAVTQNFELFNFVTGEFELVDSRGASRFQDQLITIQPGGDLTRFVESGTGRIEARVGFVSASNRQSFSANIDQLIWLVQN